MQKPIPVKHDSPSLQVINMRIRQMIQFVSISVNRCVSSNANFDNGYKMFSVEKYQMDAFYDKNSSIYFKDTSRSSLGPKEDTCETGIHSVSCFIMHMDTSLTTKHVLTSLSSSLCYIFPVVSNLTRCTKCPIFDTASLEFF